MRNFTVTLGLALLFPTILAYAQDHRISVAIQGWGNDKILVEYFTFTEEEFSDSLYAANGIFHYTPLTDEPMKIAFCREADFYPRQGGDYMPNAQRIHLILFPEEQLSVQGHALAGAVDYRVSGSQLMQDVSAVRSQTLMYELQKDSIEFDLIAVMERKGSPEEEASCFARRREMNKEIRAVERAFIRSHPEREASAGFTLNQPLDSFATFYGMLTDEVKTGRFKVPLDANVAYYEEYQAFLENQKKLVVGQPAPDFSLTDRYGNTFTLSAFDTDKYLILDFWGSWCGPCVMGIPEMKKYYSRYADKLEIIGIACRDKKEKWEKAVSDHDLPWINLLNDESSPEAGVHIRYAIEGYPTKIILGPDKTIVAVFNGEGPDFYEKLDVLLR